MSNMDITSVMFFGDVHVAHFYISVLYLLVMSMLLIFIYFCAMFFGDVHVAHLSIFLDEQHGHHQKIT
jgi:hypothetical protein